MSDKSRNDNYWQTNIRLVLGLLSIWFTVSYLFGIVLVEWLNQWSLGGFPLGFWFAQQGSIVVFIALILAYCLIMDRLDARIVRETKED